MLTVAKAELDSQIADLGENPKSLAQNMEQQLEVRIERLSKKHPETHRVLLLVRFCFFFLYTSIHTHQCT